MFYKTNGFKLCAAVLFGVVIFLLPRAEKSPISFWDM